MSEVATGEKPASVNTRFLAAIAAALIVNSHLEAFYPVSYLAGDGLFGYGLFFFIAGIGLGLSAKKEQRPFRDYYWRRFARVYPTYWLFRLLFAVFDNDFAKMTPAKAFITFIFPTETTFIGALMVDYAILYFVLRPRDPELIKKTMYAFLLPVLGLWLYKLPEMHKLQAMSLNWLFSGFMQFEMMLLGAYMGATVGPTRKYRFGWDSVAVMFFFAVYVVMRLGLQRSSVPASFYPLLFALLTLIFYFLFHIATSYELDAILKRVPRLAQLMTIIGVVTLELYFVHERFKTVTFLQEIVFPLNIVVFWAICLPIAVVVEKGVSAFRKRILKVQ
jgi:peptidoglycan/LPS O-acetylase OafA/YrhL